MRHYQKYGHSDYILCLGHLSWTIKQYFLNYRAMVSDFSIDLQSQKVSYEHEETIPPWRISFAETGADTMTAGRVRRIGAYIKSDHFFLTYGDGISDVNLDELLAFHMAHKKLVTITGVLPPGRFGELRVVDGRVESLQEKPQAADRYINGGFMVCKKEFAQNYLAGVDDHTMLEREPFESLASEGELMMFQHGGFWQCMDNYRDWEYLNELARAGRLP